MDCIHYKAREDGSSALPLILQNAFSLSEAYMKQYGINHNNKTKPLCVSIAQYNLFVSYKDPDPMPIYQEVATKSLEKGGRLRNLLML